MDYTNEYLAQHGLFKPHMIPALRLPETLTDNWQTHQTPAEVTGEYPKMLTPPHLLEHENNIERIQPGEPLPEVEEPFYRHQSGNIDQISPEQFGVINQGGGSESTGAAASAPSSPIGKGVAEALAARKARIAVTDEQKKEALGHAGMAFFSQYANSTNPSNLGAINESFSPALAAFTAEKQRLQGLNKQEADLEQDILKQQFMERKHAEEMGFEREKLKSMNDFKKIDQELDKHKQAWTEAKTDKEAEQEDRKVKVLEETLLHKMTASNLSSLKDGKLFDLYYKTEERAGIELDKYIQNELEWEDEADKKSLIEAKRAEINKRYERPKKLIEKELIERGYDKDIISGNPSSDSTTTQPSVDLTKLTLNNDGSLNFSGMNDTELAYIKAHPEILKQFKKS